MPNIIQIDVTVDDAELAKVLKAKKLETKGVRLTLLVEFLEAFIRGVAEEEFETQLDQLDMESIDRMISDSAKIKF